MKLGEIAEQAATSGECEFTKFTCRNYMHTFSQSINQSEFFKVA